MYFDMYPRGGYYTPVKTFQVCVRKGNRDVRTDYCNLKAVLSPLKSGTLT